jgi:hypothetical protein
MMAANPNQATPFPPSDMPFIDASGRVNRIWLDFLVSIFHRTGGATGSDIAGLTALVNEHTQRINSLDGEVIDLELLIESNPMGAMFAAVLGRMAALEMLVASQPAAAPIQRTSTNLPEPVAPIARAAQALPEPVAATARPANDDLRKLIEAQT